MSVSATTCKSFLDDETWLRFGKPLEEIETILSFVSKPWILYP